MVGFKDLLLKSAGTLMDPYGTWFPQMVESYKARSEWEKTHPPEMMQGEPKIMEEKPELDPLRGFLAAMVPPDPRVDPRGFRERVHEELVMAPLMLASPALRAAKPSITVNLLKRASKQVPKHLEKSLLVGARKYAKDYVDKYGENVFEGIAKKNLRFDGIMDYGEAGKRALFTIIKKGDPRDGLTFSGPRIQKALKAAVGKGLKQKKTKIFTARPGQTQHLDIFESLPPDFQGSVEAGYMVGGKFVPKAVLEKPTQATKTILEEAPGLATTAGSKKAVKDVTERVRKGHEKVLRAGMKTFTERKPLESVMVYPESKRSMYRGMQRAIELVSPMRRDLLHELHHYRSKTIPFQQYFEYPAWKKASPKLKKYVRDEWEDWYVKRGYKGEALERRLAQEMVAQMHSSSTYTRHPEFLQGVLESPETVKVVSSMQRAVFDIPNIQETPLVNTLKKVVAESPGSKQAEVAEKAAKSLKEYIDALPNEIQKLGNIGVEAFEKNDMVAMKRVMREMERLGVSNRQTAKIVMAMKKVKK